VTVVDITTNTVITTIPLEEFSFPGDATASPDGSKVYVSIGEQASVAVIDTATNTVTNTIPVGILPSGIAFTPDGTKAYVVNGASADASVIDTATETVLTTIALPAGSTAIEIAMRPDGAAVYVTVPGWTRSWSSTPPPIRSRRQSPWAASPMRWPSRPRAAGPT
jgi:YVTN family beta-propeller protein